MPVSLNPLTHFRIVTDPIIGIPEFGVRHLVLYTTPALEWASGRRASEWVELGPRLMRKEHA